MNKRERVIAAIEHRETDFTPYQVRFTALERQAVIEATGISEPEECYGSHIELASCMDFEQEVAPGLFRNEFGVVWDRRDGSDIGQPALQPLSRQPSLEGYAFPKPLENEIASQMERFSQKPWDTFRMVCVGWTLYERAWTMRGMENALEDMLLNEDFLLELFDNIIGYDISAMDSAIEHCDSFDAFYFGDDWGQQRGLIMGAPLWRKLIGPGIARLIEHAKKRGKYAVLHSCGDNQELFPDLIDAGLDVYDTFQPEIYPIAEIKKKYGDKLSFLGGISTQSLLPFASPQEVEREVKEIIGIMGVGGGYIAAPTHDMPPDIPIENFLAMARAFQNQE